KFRIIPPMLRYKLACILTISVLAGCAAQGTDGVGKQHHPPVVAQPVIPSREFKVTDYGAVADGTTPNTHAIAAAIAACEKGGGGTVIVPAGTYFTGPIRLLSNVNLRLDEGATLLFSNNKADYPIGGFAPLPERHQSLISIAGGHDVMISGKGK